MAVFSNTITTKKGLALIAKSIGGKQITFTKIKTSDYDYPSNTNFENLTVLGSIKQTVTISAVTIENESTVRVKGVILNTGLTESYYLKNIGLYANDPEEGEILFNVTTSTISDIIPSYSGVNVSKITVDLLTTVSNSANVNLTVAPGGLVTTEMLATETHAGLVTLNTIRKEESYLSGAKYDGVFGADLKNIIAGNSYLYVDASGKGNVYKAIRNNTNQTGFLIPTSADFANITNNSLYEKVKGSGQIANWSNYGLYNDSNYEIIKANSNNEFQVRVKEWGIYMLSAKAYVHMNANSNVTLTVYNDGDMASISRNGSLSAGQEMLSLPLISNGVEAGKTIRFVVSGQIAVGSEWGYYITRLV